MKRPEDTLQAECVVILRRRLLKTIWFAVPNGGWRHIATARLLKKLGVRPGVADLILFKSGIFVAVELKVDNNVQSDDQKGFEKALTAAGGYYFIVRSTAEFEGMLNAVRTFD